MQTDHLHFLLEIARHGSINKAAEALHLPRTHLSRTLAHLEEMFGVSIFECLPRGVRPTEEGEYILARTEEALAILDEMTTHFIDQAPPVYPKYHDQYFFYCPAQMRSRGIVSQIIEAWQEQFSNAHLIHRTQRSSQISEQLSQHPNALALLLNAPALTDIDLAQCADFRFLPITAGSIVALTAANHPLAENKSVSLKTLCNERLILISQSDDEPPTFYNLLAHYGTPNVKQVIAGNMSLFYEMIATGRYYHWA